MHFSVSNDATVLHGRQKQIQEGLIKMVTQPNLIESMTVPRLTPRVYSHNTGVQIDSNGKKGITYYAGAIDERTGRCVKFIPVQTTYNRAMKLAQDMCING